MWHGTAKTVRGASHARQGAASQDASAMVLSHGRLIIAIADGAGSAACGKVGAALAARRLAEAANEYFIAGIHGDDGKRAMRRCFASARRRLEQAASCFDRPLGEFGTTALVAVATPDGVLTGHIGDGGCVAITSAGEFVTVSAPRRGRYVNETFFLTRDDYADHIIATGIRGEIVGVAAFTDGLQSEILDESGNPRPGFLGPVFRWLVECSPETGASLLDEFLQGSEMQSRSDDDLTLAVAVWSSR